MDRDLFFPFGVEIEAAWPSNAARPFQPGSYHSRRNAPPPFIGSWAGEFDRSIRPCGIEFVSPVLGGLEDIAGLAYTLQTIRETGGRTNDSCGGHVHIGFGHDEDGQASEEYQAAFTACFREYEGFGQFVRNVEEGLFALTASLHRYRVTQHAEPFKKQGGRADRDGTHYRCLNITRHHTAEFRFPAGTLDLNQMLINIALCQGLVQLRTQAWITGDQPPRLTTHDLPIEDGIAQAAWLIEALGWKPGGDWVGFPYALGDAQLELTYHYNVSRGWEDRIVQGSLVLPTAGEILAQINKNLERWQRHVELFKRQIERTPLTPENSIISGQYLGPVYGEQRRSTDPSQVVFRVPRRVRQEA